MAPKAVLDNLTLLLHPVGFERFARLDPVVIGTRSDPHFPEEQVANLGAYPVRKVANRSPGLILAAVDELMRQDSGILLASIRKEHVIAEGNCAVSAGEEDHST